MSSEGTYVAYEKPLAVSVTAPVGASTNMSITEANKLRSEIGRYMVQSINDPNRYPFGTVKFTETRFIGRDSCPNLIRKDNHPDNNPVMEIEGMDPAIHAKVVRVAPKVSRGRLLEMELAELVDRFRLKSEEAIKLRRASLGLEGPEPDPATRWDRPKRIKPPTGKSVKIPDIVGRPLSEALKALRKAGLEAEPERIASPSDQPKDYVLAVTPVAGTNVTPRAKVILATSSGLGKQQSLRKSRNADLLPNELWFNSAR